MCAQGGILKGDQNGVSEQSVSRYVCTYLPLAFRARGPFRIVVESLDRLLLNERHNNGIQEFEPQPHQPLLLLPQPQNHKQQQWDQASGPVPPECPATTLLPPTHEFQREPEAGRWFQGLHATLRPPRRLRCKQWADTPGTGSEALLPRLLRCRTHS